MGQNCCENIHLPHITKKSGHKEINFRHNKKVEVWTWGKWSFPGFPALLSLGFLFKMSGSGDRGGGFECPSALQGEKNPFRILGTKGKLGCWRNVILTVDYLSFSNFSAGC